MKILCTAKCLTKVDYRLLNSALYIKYIRFSKVTLDNINKAS